MGASKQRRGSQRLEEPDLWNYALRLLSGRAHSASELRAKLAKKAADSRSIKRVMERLQEAELLDDRRFAEAFAASRFENQGQGRLRVVRDLRQKGVAAALASEVVDSVFAGTDEVELIEAFLRRKIRGVPLAEYLAEPKHLAGAYRRLRYAGFAAATSIRVLRRYAEQAGELEGSEQEDEGPPEAL